LEGDTLVVETAAWVRSISGRACCSGPASFLERFTPSADGKRLHYTIVMTDPYR
jgi:hypothetical protein